MIEKYYNEETKRYRIVKALEELTNNTLEDKVALYKMLKHNVEANVLIVDYIKYFEKNINTKIGFCFFDKQCFSNYLIRGRCFICEKFESESHKSTPYYTNKDDFEKIFSGSIIDKELCVCKNCFGKKVTNIYLNKLKKDIERFDCNECKQSIDEKNKKDIEMTKFAKIEGVVTDTMGNLAIIKDNVGYTISENGELVAVAVGVTPDKAYATIQCLVADLKERDVVIDPKHKKPVFVEKVSGNRVRFRDVIGSSTYDRDFVPDPITGEATIYKIISVIRLVRGNRDVLAIINRYGRDRVFDVMVNQYLSYGDVKVDRIEAEINPTLIQLNMTSAMENMTNTVKNLLEHLEVK